MKVIKIGAVWCSGCLVMKSRWEEIEKKNPWLKTEYHDYDNDQEKIGKYNIKAEKLPVFLFLDKKGKVFLALSGEIPKEKLKEIILKNKNK